ncbi:MAG: nucleotidyltransferase domain-containing protein [Nanoarchaeota archaeon]|nr:nucleotidyltransferase domain-containing protein [Nanoarchaeota archaeon]
MANKDELTAYVIDFVSFLILRVKNINKIILYGSVARGDFDESSDIDLFIESLDKNLPKKIDKILEEYRRTSRYKEWKLKGIQKQFSIIVGDIESEEWKDLKRAVMNTGVTLYGKYHSDIEKSKQYVLFSFENIKPDKKRVSIFRKLYGFKMNKKDYPGLANKIKAKKIAKGALLVPIEHANDLKQFFHEKRIAPKIFDLWTDENIY